VAGLEGLGDARIAAAAKTIAYRLDPPAPPLPSMTVVGLGEMGIRIGVAIDEHAA
jgi:hypothetical protein